MSHSRTKKKERKKSKIFNLKKRERERELISGRFKGRKASLVAQMVKNPPVVQETWVRSLGGWEDPLEEGMATHSRILVWKIQAWSTKTLSSLFFPFSGVSHWPNRTGN